MRRILLAVAAGSLFLLGAAPATPASAEPIAADECQIEDPTWEVSWTSSDSVTLRECGGEGGWSGTGTGDGQLPLTGWTAGVAAGGAVALVGLGAGMYLLASRRRMTFTA